MKSFFPGMDPYLEPHWPDVHTALIGEARRALNQTLPPGLVARVEERVAVESDDDRFRSIGPGVRVFQPSLAGPTGGEGGVAIEAPYKLFVEVDPIIERFIRVIDEAGELISVIEFLSPTNKRPPGLEAFREKRAELLTAGVHVVEIDLIRTGNWRALMRPEACPPEAVSLYRATIRTAGRKAAGYLFPISLRTPLPDVPIPLRTQDRPTPLPLQKLFEAVYEDGRYDRTINYAEALHPPLEEDAGWRENLLQEARSHAGGGRRA